MQLKKLLAVSGIFPISVTVLQPQFKRINKKLIQALGTVYNFTPAEKLNTIEKKLESILQKKGITHARKSFSGGDLFSLIKKNKFSPDEFSDIKIIKWNKDFKTPAIYSFQFSLKNVFV